MQSRQPAQEFQPYGADQAQLDMIGSPAAEEIPDPDPRRSRGR
jgi:hypothetical protein